MKDTFRFVETKKTIGLVGHLRHLAEEDGRSLNDYAGRVLWKHLEGIKEEEKEDNKE